MPKGNEDLKAKIAKIQKKGKELPPMPSPVQEETDDEDMKALEKEFEERKKALQEKSKASPASDPASEDDQGEADDAGLDQAIQEYSDEGKFRVELVFQLVQLNKSMKEIADTLKGLTNGED